MTVDYKIRIENGGVTITQHIDAGASSGAQSHAVAGALTTLGTSFEASNAAKTAGQGGGDPGSLIGGGDPGSLIGGGDPGSLIGGGDPASGQIVIIGPVVIDAAGLVRKFLAGQPAERKPEEK